MMFTLAMLSCILRGSAVALFGRTMVGVYCGCTNRDEVVRLKGKCDVNDVCVFERRRWVEMGWRTGQSFKSETC